MIYGIASVALFISTVNGGSDWTMCTVVGVDDRSVTAKVKQSFSCMNMWNNEPNKRHALQTPYSGTPLIRTPLLQYFDTFCCPKCHVCVLYNPCKQDTPLIRTLSSVRIREVPLYFITCMTDFDSTLNCSPAVPPTFYLKPTYAITVDLHGDGDFLSYGGALGDAGADESSRSSPPPSPSPRAVLNQLVFLAAVLEPLLYLQGSHDVSHDVSHAHTQTILI